MKALILIMATLVLGSLAQAESSCPYLRSQRTLTPDDSRVLAEAQPVLPAPVSRSSARTQN